MNNRYSSEHPRYRTRKSYQEHIRDTGLLKAYDWAADFCNNKTVLEIGCGDLGGGEILFRNSKMKKYYAVDYNLEALITGRKRKSKALLVCSKGEEIPFKEKKFDIILTFQVIEHIRECKKLLKEIYRVIKQNGVLLLSTPDYSAKKNRNPHHVSLFDYRSLRKLLKNYFEEIEMLKNYGADHAILAKLSASGITMPEEYIKAVNIGYKVRQIGLRNRLINWMVSHGRKGQIFKYLPLDIVNRVFKAFTGEDFHWFKFEHIPLINTYPFACLSFFCICRKPKS